VSPVRYNLHFYVLRERRFPMLRWRARPPTAATAVNSVTPSHYSYQSKSHSSAPLSEIKVPRPPPPVGRDMTETIATCIVYPNRLRGYKQSSCMLRHLCT
jgi:hypothetical protein